jgi:UDP-2,3-diacylglucosamine hydrolase
METLFISDIHLNETRPDIVHIFLNFLYEHAAYADALYILGDLFEIWIGDDYHTDLHQMIIDALKILTNNGLPIYFMRGNRDFLIGKKFLTATGCKLLKDPTRIDLYGTPVVLTHGDLLCTQDKQYQRTRKLARNRFLQYLFLLCPLNKRFEIARKYRLKSQRMTRLKTKITMDVTQNAINKMMIKKKAYTLIHGHTHHPDVHHFALNRKNATRLVLGSWEQYGSFLNCRADEITQTLSFQPQSVL